MTLPSVLWRCWLGGRKGIRPVKNWVVGCWRGCLGWGTDLHIAQQMPLPLTISCSSKSRLVLTFLVLPFWYLLTRVVPDIFQKSSKTAVCVCVYFSWWLLICAMKLVDYHISSISSHRKENIFTTVQNNIGTKSNYWCIVYPCPNCAMLWWEQMCSTPGKNSLLTTSIDVLGDPGHDVSELPEMNVWTVRSKKNNYISYWQIVSELTESTNYELLLLLLLLLLLRYEKKHSPTHTYCGHQSSLISFLHLLRSMASFTFNILARQSSLHNLCPSFLWCISRSGTLHFILHTFLHPVIVLFSQHMPIPLQPVLL